MHASSRHRALPWLATRAGRRYKLELGLVVLVKLIALTILYFSFIAPQPRADTAPDAVQRHLLDATSAADPGASP